MTRNLLRGPPLIGLAFLALLAARAWAAEAIPTPWILIDELLYASLAESVADGGRLAVRGESIVVSVLYPLLIAPAWLADGMETTYRLAKLANVAAMSIVAVPVYLWACRLAGARGGVLAAGLTLLLPAFVYTGSLMTENLFLPLFVASTYALARALEHPSLGSWLVVLGLVALAVATRLQGLVLVPIVVTGAAVHAALELTVNGRSPLRRLVPLLLWVGLPAAALAASAAVGSAPGLGGSPYEGVLASRDYEPGQVGRWAAYDAGALVLASGVIPVLALLALAARVATAPRTAMPGERAFVAVAVASACWLVALAALASTWDPVGIRERYLVHAAPLLLIALVLWLARGLPRPGLPLTGGAAATVALLAALPLRTIFGSGSFLGDGFSFIPFWRLARVLPGGVDTSKALLLAGALAAVVAAVGLPRRFAAPALPALVAAFLAATSAAVFATARSQATGVALASGQAERPTWIDDAAGHGRVVFLNTTRAESRAWVPVWQAEFWNRSFSGVVNLGAEEPSPLPQREGRLLDAQGHVAGVVGPYVLVRAGSRVAGRLVAGSGDLRLYRVEPPVRLRSEMR
ncbi:MAG: glycosyltransferase family 39 protein [Thermoleophilia bacterium]|nr:glycosyltransferase family 39 protein [Thermoleophilia bacterium]